MIRSKAGWDFGGVVERIGLTAGAVRTLLILAVFVDSLMVTICGGVGFPVEAVNLNECIGDSGAENVCRGDVVHSMMNCRLDTGAVSDGLKYQDCPAIDVEEKVERAVTRGAALRAGVVFHRNRGRAAPAEFQKRDGRVEGDFPAVRLALLFNDLCNDVASHFWRKTRISQTWRLCRCSGRGLRGQADAGEEQQGNKSARSHDASSVAGWRFVVKPVPILRRRG